MGMSQTVAPTSEPITADDVKTHCRIDVDDEDSYIGDIIEAVRTHVEDYTDLQLMTATWALTLPAFPSGRIITLSHPPLQSVSSIAYLTSSGTSTMSSDDYRVLTDRTPGQIQIEDNTDWPSLYYDVEDNVTVTYKAGYASASAVPAAIKHAMLLLCAHLYEQREPIIVGSAISSVPMSVRSLLYPYRQVGV
jgi:uncharacterized phiE125 gp8 family phage protein